MVKPASCHLANRTSRWFTKEAYATIEAIRSPSLANFDSSSISMLRRLRTAPAKSSRGCGTLVSKPKDLVTVEQLSQGVTRTFESPLIAAGSAQGHWDNLHHSSLRGPLRAVV